METQTGEMEASHALWAEWGQAWCGMVGRRGGGERGEWPPLETSRGPLNWRCGSPACCLLRSAGCCCCCVWCDGWTGWSIIIGGAGKDFQKRRTARHTPRTPSPSVPTGRLSLSRLLSRWHPARSWSPSLCHRIAAAVWATGPFIKAAGTLDRSSMGKRRWHRRISPECGCHCDDGISPGTDPEERALPAWKGREESAQPLFFHKSASGRIDRKRRATSHWRHRRYVMRPFGFGSTPASSRGTLTHPPVDGALVPLDSRRKKGRKNTPTRNPGRFDPFSPAQSGLQLGHQLGSVFCACKGQPHHSRRREDG